MVALRGSKLVETLPEPERRSPIRHERYRQPHRAGSETGAPFAGPDSHALNRVSPSHSIFAACSARRRSATESQLKERGCGRRLSRSIAGFSGVLRLVRRTQPCSRKIFAERNEVRS